MCTGLRQASPVPPTGLSNAHLHGQPLIVVCSWHVPLAELLALGRQYPGRVSHALCEACAARFERSAVR